jgi:hypothetical protein
LIFALQRCRPAFPAMLIAVASYLRFSTPTEAGCRYFTIEDVGI